MQHQILINVIIFVAYVLNLPLNTQRSHSRSQRAGKWSLILAHDRRPIYRAPIYIAVPLLGPHQPRYIGLTLYWELVWILSLSPGLRFGPYFLEKSFILISVLRSWKSPYFNFVQKVLEKSLYSSKAGWLIDTWCHILYRWVNARKT